MHIYLSDFLVNSAGFAYTVAGRLKRTITDSDIPASVPVRLNTKTFEEIFPPLYAKYPDMFMTLGINAPTAPVANLVDDKMTETVTVDLGFNVVDPTARITSRYSTIRPAFTLTVVLVMDIAVRADGATVKGAATFVSMALSLKDSAIGPIDIEPARPLFEMVVKEMVVPKVNEKLEKGITIPVIRGMRFVNPVVALKTGYVAVHSNVALLASELPPLPFEVDQALYEDEQAANGEEEEETCIDIEDNLIETDSYESGIVEAEGENHSHKTLCSMEECHRYFSWCTEEDCHLFEDLFYGEG